VRRGAQRANSTEGEQCSAFIETGRPGGDASVPNGDVFPTVKEAEQDAAQSLQPDELGTGTLGAVPNLVRQSQLIDQGRWRLS
jgi:hypothetical protein